MKAIFKPLLNIISKVEAASLIHKKGHYNKSIFTVLSVLNFERLRHFVCLENVYINLKYS